jgi:hypothetical protein
VRGFGEEPGTNDEAGELVLVDDIAGFEERARTEDVTDDRGNGVTNFVRKLGRHRPKISPVLFLRRMSQFENELAQNDDRGKTNDVK